MDTNEITETAPVKTDEISAGKVVALIITHIVIRVAMALTVQFIVVKLVERSAARRTKKAQKTN
jgi:multisubunit Na+/H+ antiporter MnhC subunit